MPNDDIKVDYSNSSEFSLDPYIEYDKYIRDIFISVLKNVNLNS